MYQWLTDRFGEAFANIVYGAWYALLALGITLFGSTPETTLRYLNL